MTPKEKAQDLVESYKWFACWGRFEDEYENLQNSKKCALIAVDEVIANQKNVVVQYELKLLLNGIKVITFSNYWEQVKQEIEKL